jgi:hypothetical protein
MAAVAAVAFAVFDVRAADTWYERYERGLDLERQGLWEEAAREFGAALQTERVPRRKVVTHGRDVLLAYDPHFHLARCLVELRRFKEAGFHLALARKAGVTPSEQIRALARRIEDGLRAGQPTAPPPLSTEVPIPTPPAPTAAAAATAAPTAAPAAPTPAPVDTVSPTAPPLPTAAPTPQVTPLEFPEKRSPAVLVVVLASAALVVVATVVWRGRHRSRRSPAGVAETTVATRGVETAATVIESQGRMGGYELIGVLGRGGMATTYQARRDRDGAMVALKVPHEGCLADPTFLARFLREGRLGEQLHPPRIVKIFEAGEQSGRPFLAMELLEGRTLKQMLREEAPLPLRKAVEIARDIAEALDYAHAKGVIHRDLKPENIMMLEDGALKVMDFGIARVEGETGLTASQFFLGTPLYAAPEMLEPKRIDHRVDLYALGIILYEMFEGTVPFSADSPFRVLEMHMHRPLPGRAELPRTVPETLWHVVERLCEKDPAARYASAELLLVELHHLLQHFSELEGCSG